MISCEAPSKGDKTQKLIIGHGGASAYAKENTIESFKKAIDFRTDVIEFDVRRTKDKVLIAYHDEQIQGQSVKNLTYEEIVKIARNQEFEIAMVEEALRYTKGKIKLDVELKEEAYEKEIVELLLKYFKEDQFVITSFYDNSLKLIKDSYPEIKVGLILGINKPKNLILTRLSEFFPMRRCREAKADFLVPHWKMLKLGFLERVKRADKPVHVWTVNDEEMILKFLNDQRIDGIITDKPDLALSLRKKR